MKRSSPMDQPFNLQSNYELTVHQGVLGGERPNLRWCFLTCPLLTGLLWRSSETIPIGVIEITAGCQFAPPLSYLPRSKTNGDIRTHSRVHSGNENATIVFSGALLGLKGQCVKLTEMHFGTAVLIWGHSNKCWDGEAFKNKMIGHKHVTHTPVSCVLTGATDTQSSCILHKS